MTSKNKEKTEWQLSRKALEYISLKRELLQFVNRVRHLYSINVVDELAEDNVTACRLPPYHNKLNPMEFVWSQMKCHIAPSSTI